MSSSRKTKSERIIEQENVDKMRSQKKNKQKKRKKKQQINDTVPQEMIDRDIKKINKQKRHNMENHPQKQCSSTLISNTVSNSNVPHLLSLEMDPIASQLSLLTFTTTLSPSMTACELINQNLQMLTISIYEKMIMKQSLITQTIQLAKKQLLTPKQYIAIDYTNKLILIKQQLMENGQMKYRLFIKMIEEEVDRVEALILRCIDDVRVFDQVLMDLRKNNIEWETN